MKEIISGIMVVAGLVGFGYSIGRMHEMHVQKKEGKRILAELQKNAQMWAQEHDAFMSGKTQTAH